MKLWFAGGHLVPVWQYFAIYAALLGFTGLTVLAAFQDLGRMNNVVALGIAVAKATLVVLVFMHLKYDHPVMRALFVGPLIIAIAIILAVMALFSAFVLLPRVVL